MHNLLIFDESCNKEKTCIRELKTCILSGWKKNLGKEMPSKNGAIHILFFHFHGNLCFSFYLVRLDQLNGTFSWDIATSSLEFSYRIRQYIWLGFIQIDFCHLRFCWKKVFLKITYNFEALNSLFYMKLVWFLL